VGHIRCPATVVGQTHAIRPRGIEPASFITLHRADSVGVAVLVKLCFCLWVWVCVRIVVVEINVRRSYNVNCQSRVVITPPTTVDLGSEGFLGVPTATSWNHH